MKGLAILAFGLALAGLVAAQDDPTTALTGVQDLTPDNFDQFVNGKKHALVEFYAPWCGHCKRMTGEYKQLGEAVLASPVLKNSVVVAKVNADAHRTLGERFGVRGFPTIKYFARGQPVTEEKAEAYNGARTSDQFLDFLMKKVEADKSLARVEALDKLAKKFVAAKGAEAKKVLAEAEKAVKAAAKEEQENAKLYETFMKRALEKGVEYFEKEQARLERMIGTGSVAAAKVDEMSRKISVLTAFTEKEEEAAKADADDDDDDEVDEE